MPSYLELTPSSSDAFNVMNNVSQSWEDYDTRKIKPGDTIRWNVEIYMYGTGAPVFVADDTGASVVKPKFKEDGGEIIILLTHSGTITLADVQSHQIEYLYTARESLGILSTSLSALTPKDSTGRQATMSRTGMDLTTDVNPLDHGRIVLISDSLECRYYERRMPMFKNNGHEVFDFSAQYKDIYTLNKAQQSAELHNTYLEACLRLDGNHIVGGSYPIHGLSSFRVTDLDVYPFDFTLVHDIHGSYEQDNEERYMSVRILLKRHLINTNTAFKGFP
ncbi:hypothetical protein BDN71DRAFT_1505539 [Pleurotus eryngii]|uniref:Uncharacterized protein n=1 Tax=Pleurotus eryngii TaxID=5323 RepID=A0A9P5ZYI7_PLEER|nr:hypothetical protein BDN71DRAFT_1505539 [Pleurotus eryngii]